MAPWSTRRSMAPMPLAGGSADGLQVGRALVECRVVTAGRGLVVLAHRARQCLGRNAEVGGQLFRGGRGVADPESDQIRLVDHVIGDHVDEAVLVAEGVEPDAAGVGILVDESLALAIDEDSPGEAVGRPERQRALEGVEPGRRRAGAGAHADPAAVVVRGADPPGRVGNVGQWAMLGHHRLVVDEPAGGQDHPTTGPDGAGPVVGLHAASRRRRPPSTTSASARASATTRAPLLDTAAPRRSMRKPPAESMHCGL